MNKNTTDITLSAYFNDIVIGYYEDEDLVKQFGRQLGFDVDMDTFMAVSFQYPSDMNVKPEDREKLTDAANAIIALSDINKKIGGKQIITCDSGDCVILIMKDKSAMRDLIPQIKETALQEVEKISADRKIRVGIGTIENGIKGIKHTYAGGCLCVAAARRGASPQQSFIVSQVACGFSRRIGRQQSRSLRRAASRRGASHA